jgi:hypothetical protein
MRAPAVVLDDRTEQTALRVPDGKPTSKLRRKGEQIQLLTQLAVIAPLRFLEPLQIGV